MVSFFSYILFCLSVAEFGWSLFYIYMNRLPAEWTGSPVRMVKADGKQSQKHRRWRLSFPCFKFWIIYIPWWLSQFIMLSFLVLLLWRWCIVCHTDYASPYDFNIIVVGNFTYSLARVNKGSSQQIAKLSSVYIMHTTYTWFGSKPVSLHSWVELWIIYYNHQVIMVFYSSFITYLSSQQQTLRKTKLPQKALLNWNSPQWNFTNKLLKETLNTL